MLEPSPPPTRPLLERPIVRFAIAALVLAILAGAAFAASRGRGDSGGNPQTQASGTEAAAGPLDSSAPVIGEKAPDFQLLRSDGTAVRLSDFRGKVVWLNFWATWCVPCKQELPDIQKIYDEKRGDGLEVLEINYQEGRADALAYFEARNLTLPLLLDSGSVFEQYKLQGLPDSFFIDRDGNLSSMYIGLLTEDKMRQRLADAGLP
jgi:thiol-disulfide isomerase/thioredoxin